MDLKWIDTIFFWIGKKIWQGFCFLIKGLWWLILLLFNGLFGNISLPRKIISWVIIVIFSRIYFNNSINQSGETFKLIINIITFGVVPLSFV